MNYTIAGLMGALIIALFGFIIIYDMKTKHQIALRNANIEIEAMDSLRIVKNQNLIALQEDINEKNLLISRLEEQAGELAALSPLTDLLSPNEIDTILSSLTDATPFDNTFRVTSRFGEGRGYQGSLRNGHLGNDLVPLGDWSVYPIWEGTVSDIGIDAWLGKYVVIMVAPNIRTRYAHLEKIFYTALPGEKVTKETRVAIMGNSGFSDGAHLHAQLEIFDGEKWRIVDIYPWLLGHGK